jgi:hypothetical protein
MTRRATRRASAPPSGHGRRAGRAVISLATAGGRFPEALVRLGKSLDRVGFRGEFAPWTPGHFPPGCPAHADVPFAFKPFCLAAARERGLRVVLWMDSGCVAIRSLDPVFSAIADSGYALFRNPGRVGEWCADATLAALGVERDQAMQWPELNAAAIGLDLEHPLAAEFIGRWHDAALQEVPFRGTSERLDSAEERRAVKWNTGNRVSADPRVRGHRHDQSVAGILAARLGMLPLPEGLEAYRTGETRIRRRTAIVVARDEPGAGPLIGLRELDRARRAGALHAVRGRLERAAGR